MYTDVMGDIETTGTDPDNAAIIQICLVRFNLHTRAVDTNVFNRCLSIKPRRFWDEDTRLWWGKMPDVYKGIMARAEPPEQVIRDMVKWVGYDELHFWGKPVHFDFSFIDSYCKDYGINNPFHWRAARDLNSFLCGLNHTNEHTDVSHIPFEGIEHDAFYDSFHQIKILFDQMDRNVQASIA